jgi:hypothetical protein
VPADDQEKPPSPGDERLIGDEESDDFEPDEVDVKTSFERMLSVLKKTAANREEITGWIAAWLPLVVALKSLAATATKLVWRARQLVDRRSGDEADGDAVFDQEMRDEIQADFAELVDAFPEASALFFGVDDLDSVVRETLQDEDAQAVVARFASAVEAKMNGLIIGVVEWALEDGGPELSVEKLEAFVSGLEKLLEEVMERWVLPQVYGKFDE